MHFILNKCRFCKVAAQASLAVSIGILLIACDRMESTAIGGVYSGRHYNTDRQLYDRFTQGTGIQVKLLDAKDDALIQRLAKEGADSPADVLILADAARLDRATGMDLFQPIESETLNRSVPADLRDSKNRWFGFTRRLRAPMFNAEKVKANEVSRYEDLAAPALKGRLSLRNRRSVYHQSLVAFMLDTAGEQEMTQWIQGMMANVAQPVFSSDTPMVGAVAQGDYGVALANSYYLGRMQAGDKGDADLALSSKVSAQRLGELNAKAVELMAANRWQ